jgi:hypothetical protein
MAKAAFNKKTLFTCKLDFNLRKKLVKCCTWSIALCGAETLVLREVDQKCLVSFEMWCRWGMEKISWTDRVRNEVLHRVKEEGNILHTIKWRKATWIGHSWNRKCRLRHIIEGKMIGMIEVKRRGGRRHKQLLDDLREKRGYWKLNEEALDRSLWRSRFERGYGLVRQTTEWWCLGAYKAGRLHQANLLLHNLRCVKGKPKSRQPQIDS